MEIWLVYVWKFGQLRYYSTLLNAIYKIIYYLYIKCVQYIWTSNKELLTYLIDNRVFESSASALASRLGYKGRMAFSRTERREHPDFYGGQYH